MYALIFQNKAVQIEKEPFEVHSSLQWINISGFDPKPETEWSYDGSKFTPPPLPTAKEQAAAEIPVLEKQVLYALAQHAAGEITKEELTASWQKLKAMKVEAEK